MPEGRLLDIEEEFRKALRECKELYRSSGFEIAQYHPELIEETPREFISRMLDLHFRLCAAKVLMSCLS